MHRRLWQAVGYLAIISTPSALLAQGHRPWAPQLLSAQATFFGQHLTPFPALYDGPNSLTRHGDTQGTDTYGAYLGWTFTRWLQGYFDTELALGYGVGHAVGLGGISNGDILRSGSVDLGHHPYVARAFLRALIPLGSGRDTTSRAVDQVPGAEPSRRLDLKLGKLAAGDDFDVNRYANSTKTQFGNWGLINDGAWDYAADTRGYTWGLVMAWIHPVWTLRLGEYLMPTFANGNIFDTDIGRARGDNLELTWQHPAGGSTIRVLAYQNHARMGIYTEADTLGPPGQPPSIVRDDKPGRRKYGAALNIEQQIADSGETGLFVRAGWNDGRTESFAYTEVDRALSAGIQVSGAHWGRRGDRVAIAALLHGLSTEHRGYLAAGGTGFLLGDGALNYGPEEIAEAYYRLQLGVYAQLSGDAQLIAHPGYNRDRGPAAILGLRLNLRY